MCDVKCLKGMHVLTLHPPVLPNTLSRCTPPDQVAETYAAWRKIPSKWERVCSQRSFSLIEPLTKCATHSRMTPPREQVEETYAEWRKIPWGSVEVTVLREENRTLALHVPPLPHHVPTPLDSPG